MSDGTRPRPRYAGMGGQAVAAPLKAVSSTASAPLIPLWHLVPR